MQSSDSAFGQSVAEIYESHLVPLLFEPYARDMIERLAALQPSNVLEVAAGTGVVTRAMASSLPARVAITATDLNQAMLDRAMERGTSRPVTWRTADALALPFDDAQFDAVVCQFGAMFFPDKARGFSEARRVLVNGGVLLFSVWDRIEENEVAYIVTSALSDRFPADPPSFLRRTPHGYLDRAAIERDLRSAGFTGDIGFETVVLQSRAESPETAAVALCQGSLIRNEIEARDPSGLAEATAAATEALRRRYGDGPVDGRMQAHVVTVRR